MVMTPILPYDATECRQPQTVPARDRFGHTGPMSTPPATSDQRPEHLDVLIVGAGLSGIGAAARLRTELPGHSFAILEARDAIGGTWDLFRYPGIRSDSDMYTLGYPFKPWTSRQSIADGGTILEYIRETAREYDVEKSIRFHTKVVGAEWSTEDARWMVTVEDSSGKGKPKRKTLTASFLYSCTGYYDYENPYRPEFPGIESYAGQVVHPQFWPEDLDYAGKRVVVIGSGATAVTLVPSMAEQAAHVTMLQRTPTWIGVVPKEDKLANQLRSFLPDTVAYRIVRAKNVAFNLGVYEFCRRQPARARQVLTGFAERVLKDKDLVAEHFTPAYDPWDQRLCAIPDADLFRAIRKGSVDVVTDHIEEFVPEGIRLKSGHVLEADIVVTATGLKLLALGGIKPVVDGREVVLADEFAWQGTMISGIPNFALCIGYTNASWTLRGDLNNRLLCKILATMREDGADIVVPVPDPGMPRVPLLGLQSGYILRSLHEFPSQGDRAPWKVRQNYPIDAATTMRYDLRKTLRFLRRGESLPVSGEWKVAAGV